jgi:hypothetical protein
MTNRGAITRTIRREQRPRQNTHVRIRDGQLPLRSSNEGKDGGTLADDGLYRAMAVGISLDGGSSTEHDANLYWR